MSTKAQCKAAAAALLLCATPPAASTASPTSQVPSSDLPPSLASTSPTATTSSSLVLSDSLVVMLAKPDVRVKTLWDELQRNKDHTILKIGALCRAKFAVVMRLVEMGEEAEAREYGLQLLGHLTVGTDFFELNNSDLLTLVKVVCPPKLSLLGKIITLLFCSRINELQGRVTPQKVLGRMKVVGGDKSEATIPSSLLPLSLLTILPQNLLLEANGNILRALAKTVTGVLLGPKYAIGEYLTCGAPSEPLLEAWSRRRAEDEKVLARNGLLECLRAGETFGVLDVEPKVTVSSGEADGLRTMIGRRGSVIMTAVRTSTTPLEYNLLTSNLATNEAPRTTHCGFLAIASLLENFTENASTATSNSAIAG
ncbi:hypothetical protein JCM11251_005893 [Rhodosporidiobolus azoricus]